MKIPTIAEQWAEYAIAVMPPSASAVQRREMRRAFYAGTYSMLIIQRDMIGHPDVSVDAGVRALVGMLAECERFQRDMLAGEA